MKRTLNAVLLLVLVSSGQWQTEIAEHVTDTATPTDIALDSMQYPFIVYSHLYFYDLRYCHWNGFNWDKGVVEQEEEAGEWPSVELDAADNPHISYRQSVEPGRGLWFARWDGASWELELVDSVGNVGMSTSLALGLQNEPHISYIDWGNSDLKYAHKHSSSIMWATTRIDSVGNVYGPTSIALDSCFMPRITYCKDGCLMYARYDGDGWTCSVVDSTPGVGGGNSLDRPHIAYANALTHDLKYAHLAGDEWQIETVVESGRIETDLALALDNDDNPYISFFLGDPAYDLKCAHWNGSEWSIEVVDSEHYTGQYNSIVTDSLGRPHIAYFDDSYCDMVYAWLNYPPPDFSLVAPLEGDTLEEWPLLDWEAAPDYPLVLYDIWYGKSPDLFPHSEITGLTESDYQFSEGELDPDTTYYWQVRAYDGYQETWSNETWEFTTDITSGIGHLWAPFGAGLRQPYPNPAGDLLVIPYVLQSPQTVTLSVFDLSSRRIADLYGGPEGAGVHRITWDCQGVANGVYLIQLVTESGAYTDRVVVAGQ